MMIVNVDELITYGVWLDERTRALARRYQSEGRFLSGAQNEGALGAYQRARQYFRNMFVEYQGGDVVSRWGRGWGETLRTVAPQELISYRSTVDRLREGAREIPHVMPEDAVQIATIDALLRNFDARFPSTTYNA